MNTSDIKPKIWFWQRIISPHMSGLAVALAERGFEVVYVAEQTMSDDRARQGWTTPELGGARFELASSLEAVRGLVDAAPVNSIHICQGMRANGLVGQAQRALSRRGLHQWIVMETVDDAGWRGIAKRLVYRRLFSKAKPWLDGVLASGHRTPDWVAARGVARHKVFPFAYFLPDTVPASVENSVARHMFRFIFVGQFIERKRLDLLISALGRLKRDDFELTVIGSGPQEEQLRDFAIKTLPDRVRWLGKMPIGAVQAEMRQADCLVLPSRHDGWGAVVSEALMVGTPVICSDTCGSAGVVKESGLGGVFPSGNSAKLIALLGAAVTRGGLIEAERIDLSTWAKSLGAEAGAMYLSHILEFKANEEGVRPVPPWCRDISRTSRT